MKVNGVWKYELLLKEEEKKIAEAKQAMTQTIKKNKKSLQKMSKKRQLQTCAICIDEITIEYECELDSCDHKYCKPCIMKWVGDVTNQCPLCTKKVRKIITRDIIGRKVEEKVKNKK